MKPKKKSATKTAPGRPTVLTPETQATVVDAVRTGVSLATACKLIGVGRATVTAWRMKGERGHPQSAGFVAALKKANAERQVNLLKLIRDAAPKNWTAAAWLLERLDPKRYGSERALIRQLRAEIERLRSGVSEEEAVREYLRKLAGQQPVPASAPRQGPPSGAAGDDAVS